MLYRLVFLCFRVRLFINALWSPAGKGLASWLSFVMSNCEIVTFPLVSWVRCGAYFVSIPDLDPLSYFAVLSAKYARTKWSTLLPRGSETL